MGLFAEKFGIKLFSEAEVDGQDVSDPNDQHTDYTLDQDNQQPTPENNQEEQPQEEANNNEQDNSPNNMPDEEATDYTEEDSQAAEEDSGRDSEAPPQDSNEEQPVDDLKKQEEELLNNLSTAQLDIKHSELKKQFLDMYDIVTSILERIGDAAVSEENIGVIEFISDKLSSMKQMLVDYIQSVYSGKSYIENSITYNRFLAVLNGINKILEDLEKKEDK